MQPLSDHQSLMIRQRRVWRRCGWVGGRHTYPMATTTSDAAFLAEVENFLNSSDLLTLAILTNPGNRNEASNFQNDAVPPSMRMVNIAPQPQPTPFIKGSETNSIKKAGAKWELKKAKDRKRRRAYRERRQLHHCTALFSKSTLKIKM
ncbi:unnamed protein product [Phytophthora fragariaefolia]|uniref:Unnamed protein product n=1 Tax=Phytophthora fragariaefolia TaxID=1490495 RepID=A0A9W7CUV1_9STRA|nr:unnamed protein product [Phytophthora fragariaefolia]